MRFCHQEDYGCLVVVWHSHVVSGLLGSMRQVQTYREKAKQHTVGCVAAIVIMQQPAVSLWIYYSNGPLCAVLQHGDCWIMPIWTSHCYTSLTEMYMQGAEAPQVIYDVDCNFEWLQFNANYSCNLMKS